MRLFVALELPGHVRDNLVDLIARLRPLCREARWVQPEGMHVTLKFIGHAIADADEEKLARARAALATVKSSSAVDIHYRGIGFFPNARRPNVFWCGIQASANLAPLAANIDQALEALGVPRETRAFLPHLTLARFKDSEGIDALAHAAKEFVEKDFGSSQQTEFHLFESTRKPGGAEYLKIESYAFLRTAA